MYAILRQYRCDAANLAAAREASAEAQVLHAQQPGYAGGVVIEDGQRLTAVNLWITEQAAAAGRDAIGAQVQHLLEPLMTGASEVIAVGEVVASDLAGDRHEERTGRKRQPVKRYPERSCSREARGV
jgi:hypothetical protein